MAETPPRTKTFLITVECADCDRTVTVEWPVGQYSWVGFDELTLDGTVKLPEGWWTVSGVYGGDNLLRCPDHSKKKGESDD